MKYSLSAITTISFLLNTLAYSASIPLQPVNHLDRRAKDTQNDITDGLPCKKLTLIFARGTTQSGNLGSNIGPQLSTALSTLLGTANVATQGVNNYRADIPGFLVGGSRTGSQDMADLVKRAMKQCPDTKVVMSGYSQGGQLVHNAAAMLESEVSKEMGAVIIFGDPMHGQAVGDISASKVKVYCHTGDNICDGGIMVLPAHMNYGENVDEAASFIVEITGLG